MNKLISLSAFMILTMSWLSGCSASMPRTGGYDVLDSKHKTPLVTVRHEGSPLGRVVIREITFSVPKTDETIEFDTGTVKTNIATQFRSAIGSSNLLRLVSDEKRADVELIVDITRIAFDAIEIKGNRLNPFDDPSNYDQEGNLKNSWVEVELDITFREISTGDHIASGAAVGIVSRENGKAVTKLEDGSKISAEIIMRPTNASDIPKSIRYALSGSIEKCRAPLLGFYGEAIAEVPTR